MEPELNCSSHCDSALCLVHSGANQKEILHILHRLCNLSMTAVELPRRSLSPVLSAVVWTLLSCGILLAFCFLFFTLCFKNNRIVKMSSPNLNVLTLFGSILTYSSGFLFAIDDRTRSQSGAATAVLQARVWTLCVGTTLVFGPILGKTWRLYRVFTQRVPGKRVIIPDIQLMGMVALLILLDMLVLTAWNLTDPIRCSRSVGAVVKVLEQDVFYSLSQLDSCSSVYSDLWVIIIVVLKGCLLFYGTYLAGLTSNVSHPPVNQSPTIITAVSLVALSSAVAVPVSIFLQAWPNLVYSTVAGAIFICTLATNCMIFVPQLTQCRQFEEDHSNPSQMAKYFSSPSKSQASVYSQEEIYYLLGENNSMKKLLNEKNAVIDSLQEQVNNAKDKLLRLMSSSEPNVDQEMDSSATNLNSSSTQTTELQADGLASTLPQRAVKPRKSASHLSLSPMSSNVPSPSEPPPLPNFTNPAAALSPLPDDEHMDLTERRISKTVPTEAEPSESITEEDLKESVSLQSSGLLRPTPNVSSTNCITSLHSFEGSKPREVEALGTPSSIMTQIRPNARLTGFVSSEQLQEILQELSVDAVLERMLRSPSQASWTPSQLNSTQIPPLTPHTPQTRLPPAQDHYPSISPNAMRKRRPPFHSSRTGVSPPCFYLGVDLPDPGKVRNVCEAQQSGRHTWKTSLPSEGDGGDDMPQQLPTSDLEVEQENEEVEEGERHRVRRKCQRSHRCSVPPHAEHGPTTPMGMEVSVENRRLRRHYRDSCGYWDSDSSSSTDYCYYHRPYCDSCLQGGLLLSTDTSSDSSDSEYDGYTGFHGSQHPVVFKDDLKPTFV